MKKIKLNNLSARKMNEKQMDVFNGGKGNCGCSCYYEYKQGSSVEDNYGANNESGIYKSKKGSTIKADYPIGRIKLPDVNVIY